MKQLTIKLKVKDDLDAYKAVTRLGFQFEVEEATFNSKTYKFSKIDQSKKLKLFLRDDFGKKT